MSPRRLRLCGAARHYAQKPPLDDGFQTHIVTRPPDVPR
jgi:hypothetical protein